MGKKRKGGNAGKESTSSFTEKKKLRKDVDLQSSLLDPTDRNFIYDAVDDFHDTREHESLQTAIKLMDRKGPAREQVLGISGSSSEEEEDDEDDYEDEEDGSDNEEDQDELYMEDDIVDEPEFEMPDEQAWGNRKHRYFGTDTSDERIKWNLYNQDEEMAQLEEETARKLQERMAAELKDLDADDLILQTDEKEEKEEDTSESLVEMDLSSLSRSRKLQLLKRESPEFLPLIEDLKSKCEELQCILSPLMKMVKAGKVSEVPVQQYIMTKYRLVLNYVSTVSMYMLVKCSYRSVRDHPVVSRLAQYRQLLKELEPCDNKLASHLGQLLSDAPEIEEDDTVNSPSKSEKEKPRKQKKQLKILKSKNVAKIEERKRLMALLKEPVDSKDNKKEKRIEEEDINNVMEASSDEEQEATEDTEPEKRELDADEKRSIGYNIAKNKGLMPYRNKDQRNPRVRYRNKYTKKVKRRKGQVANVRKEVNRYEGEMTGIKSHTVRSVKIKS